jgi:hypothetical protein
MGRHFAPGHDDALRNYLYTTQGVKRQGQSGSTLSTKPEMRHLAGNSTVAIVFQRPHLEAKQAPEAKIAKRNTADRVCAMRNHGDWFSTRCKADTTGTIHFYGMSKQQH